MRGREFATLALAIGTVMEKVRRGGSPFGDGPLGPSANEEVSQRFSKEFAAKPLADLVEHAFKRGDDVCPILQSYAAAVFAQGMSAGIQFARMTERN